VCVFWKIKVCGLCWNFKRAIYKTWPVVKLIEGRKNDPNRKVEIAQKRATYVNAKKAELTGTGPRVFMGREAQVAFVQKNEKVLRNP